jgi:hypothetical protein
MMNEILLTALSAMLAKMVKSAGPINPGSYTVDETVTLRVAGTVEKGDDESYVPTISVPVKALAATLLPRLGATREAGIAVLVEAITEALNTGVKADATLRDRMKDADAAFALVNERVLATLPESVRTGKTRVDATLVAVTAPVAAPVAP